MNSILLRRVTNLVLVLGVLLTIGWPTLAAADDEKITWAVQPADADGPDGRHAINVDMDPGEVHDDFMVIRNISDVQVDFKVRAADGYFNKNGRFNTIPSSQESVDAGLWITVQDVVTVPAQSRVVVPIRIEVPMLAEPGDHAAGISASVLSSSVQEDGTQLGLESRVGFRTTIRVKGEITPSAEITGATVEHQLRWNPLKPGAATVTFNVTNTGNARFLAEGYVRAGTGGASFPEEGDGTRELLPGDDHQMVVLVKDVWPLFVVGTEITLQPRLPDGASIQAIVVKTSGVAIPWPQLLVLLGIALIVVALLWNRIRSRKRLEIMLASAREEGRRAATAVEDAPGAGAAAATTDTIGRRPAAPESGSARTENKNEEAKGRDSRPEEGRQE